MNGLVTGERVFRRVVLKNAAEAAQQCQPFMAHWMSQAERSLA